MARLTLGDQAHGALEAELLNEKVQSLGRAGRAAKDALERLAAAGDGREALLGEAAEKVWNLLVQREICGLVNLPGVLDDLEVPAEVRSRLGAKR